MRSHIALLLLFPVLAAGAIPHAQEHATPEQRYQRAMAFSTAVHGGRVQPTWLPTEEGFHYSQVVDGARTFWKVTPAGREPLLDVARLLTSLEQATGKAPEGGGVPFSELSLTDEGDVARFTWESKAWSLDLESYALTERERPSGEERDVSRPRKLRDGFTSGQPPVMEAPSPNGEWLIGDDERNLTLRAATDEEARQLTTDGEEDHVWSASGTSWAPNGRQLVAGRADTRGLDRLPVVDWLEQVESVEFHAYTKAGRPMARTELHFVDIPDGASRQLQGTGVADHYVTALGWREKDSEFWFQRMNRRYNRLEVLASSAETGETRTVLTEESETFIGALFYHTDSANYLHSVGDDEHFLWISERDGWRHLYLYGVDGTLMRRLTRGEWEVERVVDVDYESGTVFFLGHAEPDPYETHLYRVGLDGKGLQRLTEGAGEHAPVLSPSYQTFVDVWSSPTTPPRTEYRTTDGSLLSVVQEAETDSLAQTGWRAPVPFVVKAADGQTDLHGLLHLPHDFDPTRRYPVLDYIYNGPFIKWVPRTFTDGRIAVAQSLAQLGFCVLIVDGRGTIGRGKAFQDVVYRKWGQHEIPDHAAALRELAQTRPWMDLGRVGIFGGSWGGYMTLRAMLTHPDVYHAGVATAAVADLIDHASVPIEGYMGLPEDNPEGYAAADNLLLADKLEGKLLLIHGTSDVNATFSACMKMTSALVKAGKLHEVAILPGATHSISGAEGQYANLVQRDFFVRHLEPERVIHVGD